MDVLGGHHDPEFAFDFDDIAFAQRASDDFHGFLNVSSFLDLLCEWFSGWFNDWLCGCLSIGFAILGAPY
jgi:hypothetical protein